jgi:hypothetical protein
MSKRSYFQFAFLCSTLTLICFYTGCNNKDLVSIQAEKNFAMNNHTLLERSSIDLTDDGIEDTIELYTSAEAYDGRIAWDDGHTWTLVVHAGEAFYPVVRERIQYGEVQFWVVAINSKKLEAPDSDDLDMRLYVAVTSGTDFQLVCNRENGHCHFLYALAVPVYTQSEAHQGALRFAAAVDVALTIVLGADPGYTGLYVKILCMSTGGLRSGIKSRMTLVSFRMALL